MADINVNIGATAPLQDYATLTLFDAGEGGSDPGATFKVIAHCYGDCGTISNLTGIFIRGADVRGNVTFDGTNESSLAFTTRLFTTADNINVFDMKITESNGFQDVYKPLGANSFATRCRIAHTGTPTINNGDTAANKGLISCVVSTGGAQLIRHGFDRPATVTNVVGFGATTRGMMFSGANQDYEDCYFYDCNSAAYVGSTGLVHCASDDLTATVGFQSIASTALVATGSDDYQSASGGALDVTPFIGAFLEVSGGSTLAADSGTYLYTGADASLLVSRIMQASSGSYTYTGTSINLLKGFVLTAQSGSYSYLGQDATLTYTPVGANILIADSGSYALTGTNINFNRDRVIIMSSGTYLYQGTDIQIILPGQVWTDKPSVSTSWNNQTNATTIWTDK